MTHKSYIWLYRVYRPPYQANKHGDWVNVKFYNCYVCVLWWCRSTCPTSSTCLITMYVYQVVLNCCYRQVGVCVYIWCSFVHWSLKFVTSNFFLASNFSNLLAPWASGFRSLLWRPGNHPATISLILWACADIENILSEFNIDPIVSFNNSPILESDVGFLTGLLSSIYISCQLTPSAKQCKYCVFKHNGAIGSHIYWDSWKPHRYPLGKQNNWYRRSGVNHFSTAGRCSGPPRCNTWRRQAARPARERRS